METHSFFDMCEIILGGTVLEIRLNVGKGGVGTLTIERGSLIRHNNKHSAAWNQYPPPLLQCAQRIRNVF